MKVTLFAHTSESLATISAHLPVAEGEVEVSSAIGAASGLAAEIERTQPDLIIADLPNFGSHDIGYVEEALSAAPATSLILLAPDRSPDFLMGAMRAGVREVVPTPLLNGELKAAYDRQVTRLTAMRGAVRQGKVLAFVPAKGGSGATFLATNIAYALAARGQRVGLIDLNLHLGDAAMFVSETRPTQTIADVSREVSRIDGAFLESSMMLAHPNLWVLPAPDTPEAAIDIQPEAIERIVSVARARFDYVVLDIGRIFEASTVRALDQAEAIYLVVQLTLPFMHDARRLINVLHNLGYPRDRVRLVVNRWEKGGEVTTQDVERALGLKVELEVPNNFPTVAFSINHGIPIVKHAPKDIVTKSVVALADRLQPKVDRRPGWFLGFGAKRV